MKDINQINLLGRLGADPIQRETKNGYPVVHFSLGTSKRVREESSSEDGDAMPEGETAGETQDGVRYINGETQWHKVVVWGRQGEACAKYLKKGSPVFVSGELRTSRYQDKEGVQRYSVEVHADQVSFLFGSARRAETQESAMAG